MTLFTKGDGYSAFWNFERIAFFSFSKLEEIFLALLSSPLIVFRLYFFGTADVQWGVTLVYLRLKAVVYLLPIRMSFVCRNFLGRFRW